MLFTMPSGGKDCPPILAHVIDNDIYSTLNAYPNACEMWKAIKRLKHDESINVQDLETNLYWEFGKFTSRDGESLKSYYSRFYKMMNELVGNLYDSQELMTVSYHKIYDIMKQHQNEVNEIGAEGIACTANHMHLFLNNNQFTILKTILITTFKISQPDHNKLLPEIEKINKPTNNNLRTSSNTSRAHQDNNLRINKGTGYDNQRVVNIAWARENVGKNDNDNYNVFANDREHTEQLESFNDTYLEEQGDTNITIDSLDMSTNREMVD
nr:hypothetical protein [Tanacetum cinerariifolium]